MHTHLALTRLIALLTLTLSTIISAAPTTQPATAPVVPWVGIHLLCTSKDELDQVESSIPALAQLGVNAIIFQIDYGFAFTSHPELRGGDPITKAQAQRVADLCRANGIRPIPSLNCLGHQSWSKHTGELLSVYPQLDETAGKYPDNKGIYCRSWCPLHPDVNKIILPLIDELIDAFGADAFHVGMDEVWIMADKDCPRCAGKRPADLFAKQVNDLHDHLVRDRHVEMMIWGDRLLDAAQMHYSKWEASENDTAASVDLIPKDIVVCDWHYETQKHGYPSIKFLIDKGFRVWPSGWHEMGPAAALVDESLALKSERMLGYLSTTWGKPKLAELAKFPPTTMAIEKLRAAR